MKGQAIRAVVRGDGDGDGAGAELRDAIAERARELGVVGWARFDEDGAVRVHAEGAPDAVQELLAFAGDGRDVTAERAKVEGHEQFGIRGVSAGAFVVEEHAGRFALRLEVGGAMRTWAVPKEPSLDPAVKRFAIEVADSDADATVWDHGTYEQGGRVPWPEALDRGHAVFVLHGEKLRGGFALQRTRPGPKAQWLLVKRRDDAARRGSSGG
jgi:acylphosphatase